MGRECAGVDDSRRLVIGDDLAVSRNHLEIRLDPESAHAVLVDTSSNGTRINGVRVERSVAVALKHGDRIQLGSHALEFRGATAVTHRGDGVQGRATISVNARTMAAIVVGDVVNFSTVSEQADQDLLARDLGRLYEELREVLSAHHGTLMNYVGDAFFASWEMEADPSAADNALSFAVAGARRVSRCTADFELRYSDGSPLRMGWGVALGLVIVRLMPGNLVTALGDVVNVGFRIAGLAGRGRPQILATRAVREAARQPFPFGEPETVAVKGRVSSESVYSVSCGWSVDTSALIEQGISAAPAVLGSANLLVRPSTPA